MRWNTVEEFLNHLNNLKPTIPISQWSWRQKEVYHFWMPIYGKRMDGSLISSVYKKPTHTDRYLQYDSHHPRHVKSEERSGEMPVRGSPEHCSGAGGTKGAMTSEVKKDLEQNVYPPNFIKNAAQPKQRAKQESPKATISIPYVAGLSEDI